MEAKAAAQRDGQATSSAGYRQAVRQTLNDRARGRNPPPGTGVDWPGVGCSTANLKTGAIGAIASAAPRWGGEAWWATDGKGRGLASEPYTRVQACTATPIATPAELGCPELPLWGWRPWPHHAQAGSDGPCTRNAADKGKARDRPGGWWVRRAASWR